MNQSNSTSTCFFYVWPLTWLFFACVLGLQLGCTTLIATDHKSPKGTMILRVNSTSVSIIGTANSTMLATIVDDPRELVDEDGWRFSAIEWNEDETICVIRNTWGSHQKYHSISIFRATSLPPVTKFEKVDIGPLFRSQLEKDTDRDQSTTYSLRDVQLLGRNGMKAYYQAAGKGSSQWDEDSELDRYECFFEIDANKLALRRLWRIRRTVIE